MLATSLLLTAVLLDPQGYIIHGRRPAAGGVGACTDLTSSMIALHDMDGNNSWVNDTGTTCGSDCDFSENGDVVQDTGDFIQGTASQDFESSDGADYLSCVNNAGGCDEFAIAGSVTLGMWVKMESDATSRVWHSLGSNDGAVLQRSSGNDNLLAAIGDGSDTGVHNGDNDAMQVADGWVHAVMVHDAAADTIDDFINGAASSASATTQQDMTAASVSPIGVGTNANLIDGKIDEFFYIGDVLTAQEICYICSCDVDGTNCTGSAGSPPTDTGRNATNCGSCSLPNCDFSL